jgi:hypothetical protein
MGSISIIKITEKGGTNHSSNVMQQQGNITSLKAQGLQQQNPGMHKLPDGARHLQPINTSTKSNTRTPGEELSELSSASF